jgi:aflatoxin B1 aldehyde reductase
VHDLEEAGRILDVFQAHGHSEIDTAIVYGGGSSERVLGELISEGPESRRQLIIDTKFSPRTVLYPNVTTNHGPDHLREALRRSLLSLQSDKVDMWYLHAPDRSTPYDITLRAIDGLYHEGLFTRFGISNYAAWEVAQISELCARHGWVKPVAYQGVYNALHRLVEPELFPCLRHYGIAFYEFNPLAGGFLTDRYTRTSQPGGDIEKGSRFDPERRQGQNYRGRYWKEEYFEALEILRTATRKAGISEAEAALRWITNHSLLKGEYGDAVIIGASSAKQLEENLTNLEKGPLPEEVVKAFDEGWEKVRGVAKSYFH